MYMVCNLDTQERGTFETAHDVAMFMWGRDFSHYQIYTHGVLFPWTDGDLHRLERALESQTSYWQALNAFLGVQAAQRGLPPCGFCDKPMAECTCDSHAPTR